MQRVLVYTVHKAASMFIHKINTEIAGFLGINGWSINDAARQQAIRDNGWQAVIESERGKAVFGPIRFGEALPNTPLAPAENSIIIHVRDPRDVLTSFFFSAAYNHRIIKNVFEVSPEQRQEWIDNGIDAFVLQHVPAWKKRYETILEFIRTTDNCRIVKYEEMVLQYDRWLIPYLEGFRCVIPADGFRPLFAHCLQNFRDEFVIRPEDVNRHKRKMVPGDHKEKLASSTLELLDVEFAPILKRFGYV